MTIVLALCLLPIVVVGCYGIGKRFCTRLCVGVSDGVGIFVFSTALGLGILGTSIFCLGMLGQLHSWGAWGVLVVCLVLGWKRFDWQDFLNIFQFFCATSWRDRILLAMLSVAFIFNFLAALPPPSNADTMAYHLAVPQLFLNAKQIYYLPNVEANGPMHLQMVHLMGMLLANDRLAMLLAHFQGTLLILAMMGFCHRHLSKSAGFLSATLLYTTPMITNIVSGGYIDVGLSVFTFLAFWAVVEWHWTEQRSWLWVAGIFLGFAVGTKYYGLISVIALPVVLLAMCVQKRYFHFSKIFQCGWYLLLPAFCIGVPWYIKNLVYTGNPLYPMFFELFGGRDWSPEAHLALKGFMDSKRAAGDALYRLLTIPWEMTMNGEPFMAGRTGYGPIFLAFCPLCLWVWKREKNWRLLLFYFALFIFVFYVIWFLGAVQRGRHLLPIMPLVSILVAVGMYQAWVYLGRWYQALIGGFLLIGLGFHLGVNVIYNAQFLPVVFGAESERAHLSQKLHYYQDAEWMNANLSENARVLHFYRTINYYLDVDYYFGSIYFQGGIDWANMHDSEKLLSQLRAMEITHIFVDLELNDLFQNVSNYDRSYGNLLKSVRGLVENHAEEIYRDKRLVSKFRTLNRGNQPVETVVYQINYSEPDIGH